MPRTFPILLVDDDPALLDWFTKASVDNFPQARYQQVYSIAEAKAYFSNLQGRGPKLVFLDIDLNETLTGLDFLAYLRANDTTSSLPVVVLTVSQLADDIRKAYQQGASSFANKPFSLVEWKTFVGGLRHYWIDTVTLPPLHV